MGQMLLRGAAMDGSLDNAGQPTGIMRRPRSSVIAAFVPIPYRGHVPRLRTGLSFPIGRDLALSRDDLICPGIE